jgi:hypothetical protein
MKILLSVGLTLLLGPGVGHLYLRKFKKGWILIGVTLLSALAFSIVALRTMTAEQLAVIQKNPADFMRTFSTGNPPGVLFFDILFAALWAYAVVDSFLIAHRNKPPTQDDSNDHPRTPSNRA